MPRDEHRNVNVTQAMFDAVAKATEPEALPFPYNKSTFCNYEPIEETFRSNSSLDFNVLSQSVNASSEQSDS